MKEFNFRVFQEGENNWNAIGVGLEKHGFANTPIHAIFDLLVQYYIYFLFLDNKENLNKYESSQFKKLKDFKFNEFKNDELLLSLLQNTYAERNDFDYLDRLKMVYNISSEEIIDMYETARKKYIAYQEISNGFYDLADSKLDGTSLFIDYETKQYIKYKECARKYKDILEFIENEQRWRKIVDIHKELLNDDNSDQSTDEE